MHINGFAVVLHKSQGPTLTSTEHQKHLGKSCTAYGTIHAWKRAILFPLGTLEEINFM